MRHLRLSRKFELAWLEVLLDLNLRRVKWVARTGQLVSIERARRFCDRTMRQVYPGPRATLGSALEVERMMDAIQRDARCFWAANPWAARATGSRS